MTNDDFEDLLEELEAGFLEEVTAALDLTARDFAAAVEASTELVAAAFSVSRIGTMWKRRVSGLVTKLRDIARRSSRATAEDLGETPPTAGELDDALAPFLAATTAQLSTVGDRMAVAASESLAEGVAAGESVDELKRRMLDLFAADGPQLGPVRADRIAATQAASAFNAGTLESARLLTGEERPLVKQWITRRDARVREAHEDVDGQLQLLDDPFDVGGTEMMFPGDPTAPADLVINCRCIMRASTAPTERIASMADDFQSRMPTQLKEYWLAGPGAARIGWGTPGSFDRCVRELRDDFPQDPEGLCANLYHEATGRWPGRQAATGHTGAMIALVPSAAEAERMAVDGGESADELHLTLAFLGEAADWSEFQRGALLDRMSEVAGWLTPVFANAFGVARWNSSGPEPVWVWNVGHGMDDTYPLLPDVHHYVTAALSDTAGLPDLPQQHYPWSPHVAATYGDVDPAAMDRGTGPLVFDRLRVAFAGYYVDFPLVGPDDDLDNDYDDLDEAVMPGPEPMDAPPRAAWSTPAPSALAFENQQTGDGRVIEPGALYWHGDGPWPLQYAGEMLGGHDGAELAGAIESMSMDGDRLTASGVLYLTQDAGAEAALLLAQGAPIGVSVDLDDMAAELVDTTGELSESLSLATASLLPLPEGGYRLTGETAPRMLTAAGVSAFVSEKVTYLINEDGRMYGPGLTAAAGDPSPSAGAVVSTQSAGDYLMRITRARVRGATLVSIPAYADARIVLEDAALFATAGTEEDMTAAAQTTDYEKVLRHVRRSNGPVGPARVAQYLNMPVTAVQRHLSRASSLGEVVRITRGLYTDKTTSAKADHVMRDDQLSELAASVTGSVDLPVADRDAEWDGDAATGRVFDWADGDTGKIGQAYAYRDDSADPATRGAYKLGYADVVDGVLTIVPRAVSAALGAMNGARGGVDIPADERDAVRERLDAVSAHVAQELDGDDMNDLEASAWTAMRDLPPMPAEWFAEPTAEELPPGGPGVNYANGRIFGWVAQAGEPHAGFAKKITIDSLGRIDTSHFLRQHFQLDDGTSVKAGAYTMNVGHHRDGAECETSACQFDDTRTVAGIVTVGMNARGMWFSGAAAPWLSEWDRRIFSATQPSYHMKRAPGGGWQLRAVLSVPVPGHSSPLLASAVIERTQLALTAAASMAETDDPPVASATVAVDVDAVVPTEFADLVAAAVEAALDRREARRAAMETELAELLAEAATLDVDTTGTEGA